MFLVRATTVFLLATTVGAIKVPPKRSENLPYGFQGGDACTCLTWKEVYMLPGKPSKWNGTCGLRGKEAINEIATIDSYNEIPLPEKLPLKYQVVHEFCLDFFARIDDNFCVRSPINSPAVDGYHWCYVPLECGYQTMPGGDDNVINEKLAFKTCNPDKDRFLANYTPTELADLAVEKDLELSMLAKHAYPVPKKKWSYMGPMDIGEAKKKNYTQLFDSATGHPPYHVISEGKHYKIDWLPDGKAAFHKGRMGHVTGLTRVETDSDYTYESSHSGALPKSLLP